MENKGVKGIKGSGHVFPWEALSVIFKALSKLP